MSSGIRAGSSFVVDPLITELILDPFGMDFWKFFLLIHQLAYFVYLSLVEFVKSFLEHLGLIIYANNYLCYTVLTALKDVILVFGIWIVVVPGI